MSDLADSARAIPDGYPLLAFWITALYEDELTPEVWSSLDDPLRLALAQGWVLGVNGEQDQAAAEALAQTDSQHPDFPAMFGFLVGHWQEVYGDLQIDGFGVLDQTIIAGVDMELVVITARQFSGPVEAGQPLPAHSFITRFTGSEWVIAATARRLPVPGWPPSEQEIPGLLA